MYIATLCSSVACEKVKLEVAEIVVRVVKVIVRVVVPVVIAIPVFVVSAVATVEQIPARRVEVGCSSFILGDANDRS